MIKKISHQEDKQKPEELEKLLMKMENQDLKTQEEEEVEVEEEVLNPPNQVNQENKTKKEEEVITVEEEEVNNLVKKEIELMMIFQFM